MLQLRWIIIASLLFGACSVPAAQTSTTFPAALVQADCVRADGVWRGALGFCEYPSGCR